MSASTGRTRVTATDIDTGESETTVIEPDNHVVICGPDSWIDSVVRHANGTTQYVIKRRRS
jgi:NAD(P)H-flavin reductase